jgi:hypothetical protein
LGIGVALVQQLSDFWRADTSYRILVLCAAIALVLIATSFRNSAARKFAPLATSFCLVVIAFLVARGFTNKVAVHPYLMSWSVNGVAPWGDVERNEKGESPIVFYRRVNGGYCYDAIFSTELKARLITSNKSEITVEYNIFSDFGHERSYNIRSVDELLFNNGSRVVRSGDSYGGSISSGSNAVDCPR